MFITVSRCYLALRSSAMFSAVLVIRFSLKLGIRNSLLPTMANGTPTERVQVNRRCYKHHSYGAKKFMTFASIFSLSGIVHKLLEDSTRAKSAPRQAEAYRTFSIIECSAHSILYSTVRASLSLM